jgi:uncharacterized damage-inducible protein DinB
MSTPTHLAALDDILDSLRWLRESVAGLPVEALDWSPGPDSNSITVLVCHALPSARFWVRAGSGENPSHREYAETERREAFEMRGESERFLLDMLTNYEADIGVALSKGTEEHLAATYIMDDEPDEEQSGPYCLVHAASHLREHAGQVALTRDLWLGRAAG